MGGAHVRGVAAIAGNGDGLMALDVRRALAVARAAPVVCSILTYNYNV